MTYAITNTEIRCHTNEGLTVVPVGTLVAVGRTYGKRNWKGSLIEMRAPGLPAVVARPDELDFGR